MEKAELLPQIDAAIALLRAEVTELRLGNKDHCLQKLMTADFSPLPAAQFEGLLAQWKPPAVPAELLELMRQLEEMDRKAPPPYAAEEKTHGESKEDQQMEDDEAEADDAGPESVDEEIETDASGKEDEPTTQEKADEEGEDNASSAANDDAEDSSNEGDAPPEEPEENEEAATQRKQREADAQVALLKLQTLRKSMMLDVLSKIVSVAKSKGVDPARFARNEADMTESDAECIDLEMIRSKVESFAIGEWDVFSEQVFLFCQHVIAECESQDKAEAKQKSIELLHFARTLTDTLRKANLKKEETLLETIASAQQKPSAQESFAKNDEETVDEIDKPSSPRKPMEDASTEASPMTTPTRSSARIRQRGNSWSESGNAAQQESESESQVSASEAEAKQFSSDGSKAAASSTSMSTPTRRKRSRTRKKRPLLPATRVSSRQLKRRAAAAAAAAAVEEEPDGSVNEEEATGTGGDDDDDCPNSENGDGENDTPPLPPIPLTKSGRPRKKPGRKPKKSDE